MVGEVEDLPTRVVGFMRLKEPRILQNDLSEVNLPTRFVFFCLGRRGEEEELIEFGRCMGTMMVDEVTRRLITYMKNSFDPATNYLKCLSMLILTLIHTVILLWRPPLYG